MLVAGGEERPQRQDERAGGLHDLVDHQRGVLAVDGGHGLAQLDAAGLEVEDGKEFLAERRQVLEPPGRHGAGN